MKVDEKVLHIIEDHANITQYLDQLCCCIENDALSVPNFVPVLHDTMVTDQLGMITECINKTKRK